MVNSRLKILKNKKEIQIKQLRQELAQLLEAGWKRRQWLPLNSLASTANSLLFFRCYRVSKVSTTVASVLFTSQRLSDVPELSEIVKQFTTKYGKDFATSAIELRPDSGVSRLLICFILVPLTVLDLTRYVDMISNPEVAYVLRKRQAP
ncbi:unnamed protein product [Brassica oleracea]